MLGIIDVGGGMRGVFGAGVTDYLLDNHIDIPYCLGVSAGSANLISYITGQRGRNYRFYMQYANRPEYMSMQNFIKKQSYFDLEYVYGTLSNEGGEDPVDFDAFSKSEKHFVVVTTRGRDGKPFYFENQDFFRSNYAPLMASSAIPAVCKPKIIELEAYFDGGVSNPVPVEKAFSDGCDEVILVLTKPIDFKKAPEHFRLAYTHVLKDYPAVIRELNNRHITYNKGVEKAIELQKCGKVHILAPDKAYNSTAFSRNHKRLEGLYQDGYQKAKDFFTNCPINSANF